LLESRIRRARWILGCILVPLCLAACGDESGNILETEKKLYSQFDEELIIRDFFGDRRDGFFLDVGCGPPTVRSTTYYLEKHLGWRGIGVDALPEYAGPWKRDRPKSRFFAFLVTDHADTHDPFYRSAIEGLSSTQQDRPFQAPGSDEEVLLEGSEISLPTITLNKLLEEAGVEKIDFLSMDIEGSEPPALAGFDIKRFAPQLICIEAAPVTQEPIRAYFEANGYERIERYEAYDAVNWYFTPKQP